MSQIYYLVFIFICNFFKNSNSCFFVLLFISSARRPHLSRFYIKCIQKARLYTNRAFHFLVSLQRLATWGLGPEPSVEALAHEITTRRHEFSFSLSFYLFINIFIFEIDVIPKEVVDEIVKQGVQSQSRPPPQAKNGKVYRRGLTWVISQVGVVGRKSTCQPSLKTSNLLPPSLIKGL